jgi:hypothetical protein
MQYSGHAEDRISEYGLTKVEVESIVQNPVRGSTPPYCVIVESTSATPPTAAP